MKLTTLYQTGHRNITVVFRDGNKKVRRLITDFSPYFYVDSDDETETKSVFGSNVKKVKVNQPSDVRSQRKNFSVTYEADIPYVQRFLIDRVVVPMEKCDLRVCFFDIETRMSLDVNKTPEPILSIVAYDSWMKKKVVFLYHPDEQPRILKGDEKSVHYFNREKDMLAKFCDFIRDIDFDVLTAWNIDFDIRYFVNRCRKMDVDVNRISYTNYINMERRNVQIAGCEVFDLLAHFKKLKVNPSLSYKLNDVAERELGKRKLPIDIIDAWENNREYLIDYNVEDVMLIVELDEKFGIVEFYDELRREVGCTWDSLLYASHLVDVILLREAKNRGVVLPSKNQNEKERFKGAKVLTTKPGIYDMVAILDVKSLYPSIMISFNMSPETICADGEHEVPLGYRFHHRFEGLVPFVLNTIFEKRSHYKTIMKQFEYGTIDYKANYHKQYAMKVLMNSFYGVVGNEFFRLYDKRIAESVTSVGREIISWSANIAKAQGVEVIYGDTDSVFLVSDENDVDASVVRFKKIEDCINESYEEVAAKFNMKKNIFSINFEKLYQGFILLESKKRYAGRIVYLDDKRCEPILRITGFETIRSDSSRFTREFQKEFFELILDHVPRQEVQDFIFRKKMDLKSGKYPIEDIAIPKMINKKIDEYKVKPAVIRGAIYMNEVFSLSYSVGDKVCYVYVYAIPGKKKTDVIAFLKQDVKYVRDAVVNWDRMIPILMGNIYDRVKGVANLETTKQVGLDTWCC